MTRELSNSHRYVTWLSRCTHGCHMHVTWPPQCCCSQVGCARHTVWTGLHQTWLPAAQGKGSSWSIGGCFGVQMQQSFWIFTVNINLTIPSSISIVSLCIGTYACLNWVYKTVLTMQMLVHKHLHARAAFQVTEWSWCLPVRNGLTLEITKQP